jgi:cytochrome c oxidase subunit II
MLLAGSVLTGCHRIPANARHIAVVMKRYAFEPAEIRVRRGEVVVLDVTTADVQHGFKAGALDINESVQKGHTAQIVIQVQQPGVYPLECSVICGPHHNDMTGKLVVE